MKKKIDSMVREFLDDISWKFSPDDYSGDPDGFRDEAMELIVTELFPEADQNFRQHVLVGVVSDIVTDLVDDNCFEEE